MRMLLDSHSLVWAIQAREQLSTRVQQALTSPENDVCVSAISFWEISLKFALGKLMLQGATPTDLPRMATEHGYRLLPLDAEVAATFHQLPPVSAHKDPFDRMLVWQAIRGGLTLVSRDRIMAAYEPHGLSLLW